MDSVQCSKVETIKKNRKKGNAANYLLVTTASIPKAFEVYIDI